MNPYVTGAVIKELREEKQLTQLQLAEKLGVSDKTISKWETAKGYPDITLLEPIADALSVSVTELISGNPVTNSNVSANMMRSRFFICPGSTIMQTSFEALNKLQVFLRGNTKRNSHCEFLFAFWFSFPQSADTYPDHNGTVASLEHPDPDQSILEKLWRAEVDQPVCGWVQHPIVPCEE